MNERNISLLISPLNTDTECHKITYTDVIFVYNECKFIIQMLLPKRDISDDDDGWNTELCDFDKYKTSMYDFYLLYFMDEGICPSYDDVMKYIKYIKSTPNGKDISLYEQYIEVSNEEICDFIENMCEYYKLNNTIYDLKSFNNLII